jgi:hypothetical protein
VTDVLPRPFRRPAGRAMALAALAALTLSACGGDPATDADEAATSSSASQTSAEAPTEAPDATPAGASTDPQTPAAGTDAEEPDNSGGDVSVVTTYFGYDPTVSAVLVGGYVAGVLEDGGTCTATLTQGARSVTGTSQGSADARNTACPEIRVPGSALGSGTWTVVLSYDSSRGSGEAQPVTVQVP